jgi:hypothetical protein
MSTPEAPKLQPTRQSNGLSRLYSLARYGCRGAVLTGSRQTWQARPAPLPEVALTRVSLPRQKVNILGLPGGSAEAMV